MKSKLWLFYPENDIALARNSANFTPPAAAVRLSRACALLPVWMAGSGDRVLCPGVNAAWWDDICHTYNIYGDVWDHTDTNLDPSPWGWSKASRRIFINNGFPSDRLPDDARLECWRDLSHRRTAARLGDYLATNSDLDVWPRALEVSDKVTLNELCHSGRPLVIKSPWSSSGRGVTFLVQEHRDEIVRRTEGTISHSGSVMVEEYADVRSEFALLFECRGGTARLLGPSLFMAEPKTGAYAGNIVASDDDIYSRIERFAPGIMSMLAVTLGAGITEIYAPHYDGPVGVDIMVARKDDRLYVHVRQVNLRYTMGFLARGLVRYVSSPALFTIAAGAVADTAAPTVVEGLLSAGVQRLTPPSTEFNALLRIIDKEY